MSNRLVDHIDEQLAGSLDRILVRTAENVGDCTYAAHLPGYLAAKKGLKQLWTTYWSLNSYRNQNREYQLFGEVVYHHREMYRQPCLICPACQNRVKFWRDAAYSAFGLPRDPGVDDYLDSDGYQAVHPVPVPYFVQP